MRDFKKDEEVLLIDHEGKAIPAWIERVNKKTYTVGFDVHHSALGIAAAYTRVEKGDKNLRGTVGTL